MQQIALSEGTAARRRIPLVVVSDADGTTPQTGKTFASADIQVSKAGATEGNSAGSVTELAGGLYYYLPTTGEIDTRGFLSLRCVKAGLRFAGTHGHLMIVQIGAEQHFAENFLVLTDGVESGLTPKQALQGIFSTSCGKLSGAGSGTETFKNKVDTVNRVVATVDANGNRTAVTFTFS
jgi:hypothetical protein